MMKFHSELFQRGDSTISLGTRISSRKVVWAYIVTLRTSQSYRCVDTEARTMITTNTSTPHAARGVDVGGNVGLGCMEALAYSLA